MSGVLSGIVKLNQMQYETLLKNKTITVNGVKVDYDQNSLYIVEKAKVTLDDDQEISGTKNFTGDLKKNNVDVATINDIPPIVDVLTSDSSTSSLSAKQGKVLNEKIQNMMSTLNGKNASFTFDTLDTLLNHFPGISKGDEPADKYLINTDKITYGGQEYTLKNGDIFLIVDINVPDYWFSIDDKTLYKLETAKVDLAEYAKITDLTMYAKTSDLAEYAKTSDVSKDYLKKEDIADWAKQANPPSNVVLVDDVYQEIDGSKVFLNGITAGNGVRTTFSGFTDARRCVDDNSDTHQLSLYVETDGVTKLTHKNRSKNANAVDSYITFDSTKLKYGTSGSAGTAANKEHDIITSDYNAYKYAEKEFKNSYNISKVNNDIDSWNFDLGVDIKSGKTYTLKCYCEGYRNFNLRKGNGGAIIKTFYDVKDNIKYTFLADWNGDLHINTFSSSLTPAGASYKNIIVYEGDDNLDYYPYNRNKHIENNEAELLRIMQDNQTNLFNKNDFEYLNAYLDLSSNKIVENSVNKTLFLKCEPNTLYTVSKIVSAQYCIGYCNKLPGIDVDFYAANTGDAYVDGKVYGIIKTGNNAKYLVMRYLQSAQDPSVSGVTEQEILDSIQIEKGDIMTSYKSYNQSSHITNQDAELLKREREKEINVLDVSQFIDTPGFKGASLSSNGYEIYCYTTSDGRGWSFSNSNVIFTLPAGNYYLKYEITSNAEAKALNLYRSNGTVVRNTNGPFTLTEPTTLGIMVKAYEGIFRINITNTNYEVPYAKYHGEIIHEKDLSKVATTGNYSDLNGTPNIVSTIDSSSNLPTSNAVKTYVDSKSFNISTVKEDIVWDDFSSSWDGTSAITLSNFGNYNAFDIFFYPAGPGGDGPNNYPVPICQRVWKPSTTGDFFVLFGIRNGSIYERQVTYSSYGKLTVSNPKLNGTEKSGNTSYVRMVCIAGVKTTMLQ